MHRRGWKILILVGILILISVLALFITGEFAYKEQLAASKSIEKVDDMLYIMEYRGDYGFDAYLEQGGGSSSEEMSDYLVNFLSGGLSEKKSEIPVDNHGCSTISAVDENGQRLFGRNYDWKRGVTMVMHTVPVNGYESVSTTSLEFLGFGDDFRPEGMSRKMMAQAAIYIPMDGMNEKGLVIADLMAGDKEVTHQDRGLKDITTTAGIRLVLDHAATVDEATALLDKYDMHSDIGTAHHYAISDASGRSVVVEYIGNEMVVTDTDIVTNHYLSEGDKQGRGSDGSHIRYDILHDMLSEGEGVMNVDDMKNALMKVSQKSMGREYDMTRWSCIYEQDDLAVHLYTEENYHKVHMLRLGTDEWFLN